MHAPRVIAAVSALGGALVSCELLINTSHLDANLDASTSSEGGRDDGARPGDGGHRSDGAAHDAKMGGPEGGPSDGPEKDAPCPGKAGPTMIRVGSYCIDSTEVTGADFTAFLAAEAGAALEPAECAWKHGQYNAERVPTINGNTGPAGNVDWCDAYVYCRWAGKRLCGRIDGGSVAFADYTDPTRDQWFSACGGADSTVYPYGNAFSEDACNGRLADGGYPGGATQYTVEPVKSKATCQGGYPGIYDMSGNAGEWEDCCEDGGGGSDAAADICRDRGGSANSNETELMCMSGMSIPGTYSRASWTDDLGFRCCSP
jgi:formylglycine-generating enzyme